MKKLCAVTIGVLVVISLISIYSWHKAEEELKILRTIREDRGSMAYMIVAQDIFELSYMGDAFEKLLERNASEDTLLEYAGRYYVRARHVRRIFLFLSYEYPEGYSKYDKLWEAFYHIEGFFVGGLSRADVDRTETIRENLETLKEISRMVRELGEYSDPKDIPEELADELLNATRSLKPVYK